MCQGLGYNTTHMPNFLGHASQEEAIFELGKMDELLSSKCSPFLRLFICSLYFPLCSEHIPGAVPACNGLCEEVNLDCSHIIRRAGLVQLKCTSFPEPPDLCMQQPPDDDDFTGNSDMTSSYMINRLQKKCPANMVRVGGNCITVPQKYDTTNDDKLIVEVWILIWSILAIVVVVFTLLTFVIQPKRFRWPARPILFLTICGLSSSVLYFCQWTLSTLTCTVDEGTIRPLDGRACVVFVLLHTYFDFAYALWWCTFSYVWYLSASKEWSTEAIEKIAARVHSIVWSLSGVPIVHVLVFNSFKANSFNGFCEMSSLVLTMAQVFVVVLGMVLAVLTSQGLRSVRAALVYAGRSPHKLERLIYRLGIISLGIAVPLLVSVLCYFSDSLYVELLKVCTRYLSIIFSTLWVFSYKTFRSWNKILRPRFTHKGLMRSGPVTKV